MNELVRLPPPEDQRDYEQWRMYIVALDERESAQANRQLQNRFFLMMIAAVLALAVILGQLAVLFGFPDVYLHLLLKFAFGTLAVAAVMLIYATWLEWRIGTDQAVDKDRLATLHQRIEALKGSSEPL
jgi:uncharacterized membrane protein